mgnify:CR=1 FL=1
MTLTSPNCPVAETLPVEVEDKVKSLKEINPASKLLHSGLFLKYIKA